MRLRGDDHGRSGEGEEPYGDRPSEVASTGGSQRWPAGAAGEPAIESELVRRLRTMNWPKPPPGVKERCLTELMTRIDTFQDGQATVGGPGPHLARRNVGERYSLTRRAVPSHRAELRIATTRSPLRLTPATVRLASVL